MDAKAALRRVAIAYALLAAAFLTLALLSDGWQRALFFLWLPLLAILLFLQNKRIRKLEREHNFKYRRREPS